MLKQLKPVFASIELHKIMVQFCYLKLYLGIETVCGCLLLQMARMEMD